MMNVIAWALVGTLAALAMRVIYLWNCVSPVLVHKAVDLFL